MVGFRDLVGTGIAPVSKKTAVKFIHEIIEINRDEFELEFSGSSEPML